MPSPSQPVTDLDAETPKTGGATDDTDRVLEDLESRVTAARPADPDNTPFTGLNDPESERALESLFLRHDMRQHTIDARLSVPVFGRRFYLVILGGAEKRRPDRLSRERQRHPLLTLGNVLFLGGIVALIYALALVALLAFDGMVVSL